MINKLIMSCLDSKGNYSSSKFVMMKRNFPDVFYKLFSFLWLIYRDNLLPLNEMVFLYRHQIYHPLRCLNPACENTVRKIKGERKRPSQFGFALTCCPRCSSSNPTRSAKIRNTCQERYGGVGFANKSHVEKACATMKEKYGAEFYVTTSKFEEKRTKTYQEKYGVDSPMQSAEIRATHQNNMMNKHGVQNSLCKGKFRDKALQTVESKYGNKQIMATNHIRKMKEDQNLWMPLENKTDFELYCREVNKFTYRSIADGHLENIEIVKKFEYTVDHIYSKKQGFMDNIPPFIIGSINNLKVIPHFDNSSKGPKCGITKDGLLNSFYSS